MLSFHLHLLNVSYVSGDYFRNTLIPVEKALTDAKLGKDQIQEVVLVGMFLCFIISNRIRI